MTLHFQIVCQVESLTQGAMCIFFFFTHIWLIWHKLALPILESPIYSVAQLCLTLCGPMDCSPPGSSVHGIFQARILGRGAISYPRISSWPGDSAHLSCFSCICKWIVYHYATLKGLAIFKLSKKTSHRHCLRVHKHCASCRRISSAGRWGCCLAAKSCLTLAPPQGL